MVYHCLLVGVRRKIVYKDATREASRGGEGEGETEDEREHEEIY